MLATDRQDPILATWTVGTGRVMALTSGLNSWAKDWLTWERWPDLAAGLVNHVAVSDQGGARLDGDESRAGQQVWLVERGPRDVVEATSAQLVLPNGSLRTIPLRPEAPGVYRAEVEPDIGGRYTLVWEDDDGLHRHSFIDGRDRDPDPSAQSTARRFVEMGLVREWSDRWVGDLSGGVPMKKLLVAAVLFGLLFVMVAERVPISEIRRLLLSGRAGLRGSGDGP